MKYWIAMNLADNYASACHHIIQEKFARFLSSQPLLIVANHHNLAWKEMCKGQGGIVHCKGTTPAGNDVLRTIPAA